MATRTSSSASVWARSSRPLLWLLVLMAAGVACAGAPIAPELRGEAVPVDFPELLASPERFRGETVILGGQIISTVPTPEGTLLTVLQTRTEGTDRPKGPETSQGRFMALYKGLLDPQVYAEGRQVTVAGRVAGKRVERLGEIDYGYPLIDAAQVYLWPKPEPRYYYPYGPYGGPYGGPFWPYYYWGPYRYGPWWW